MPVTKLTVKAVEKLVAPDPSGKQVPHWDTELKGFGVLCSGTTNSKTFIAQRVLPGGRTRRVTVGAVAEITLDEARQRAADTLDCLRRGVDPKEKKENPTLKQTLEDYLAARKDLRPASIRVYRICVNNYLKPWLDLPVRSITFKMVKERHRAIATEVASEKHKRKGEIAANLAMRTFRVLYNSLADRVPDLPPNPVTGLKRQWYPEPRRQNIVRAEEMPSFFRAVQALDNPITRDLLLLILFTGTRSDETRSLVWKNVDLKQRVIRIPSENTKATRMLDLPMSDFVYDLLVARRSLGDSTFVFPGSGKKGYVGTPRSALRTIAKSTGIKVGSHDLRRTYITIAGRTPGISQLATKALVNHALGKDVTEGYVIFSTDDLRDPAQKIADRIKQLSEVLPADAENVVRLAG